MVDYDPTDEIVFIEGHLFHWYCPMCGLWESSSTDDSSNAYEVVQYEVLEHWRYCLTKGWLPWV